MRNTAYNFVRLECGILADISSPLSPILKYTLPLKIKDLLLEYHTNKFPLILNYSHSSKYRVDFYKIQNPYRNWCNVTYNICMDEDKFKNVQEKFPAITCRKNNLRDIDTSMFFIK